MTKKNAEPRRTLIQRVDHHEKVLILMADRLNNSVDPELKMLAGAIQQIKDDIADLRNDVDGTVEWIDMGVFGRIWWNIKENWKDWKIHRATKKEEANDDMAVGATEDVQPSGGEAGGGEAGHPSGAVQEAGGKEEERVVHGDAGSRSQDGTPTQD